MEVYKIVTLKDPVTGEKLIPRIPQGIQYEVVGDEITPPIDLTLDANTLNGHPLTDFLLKSDNIDADTLGGKPASDYALKSEAGASYTKGDTAEPPETLQAGSFYETSDGYLYIGNSENQPVEVLTLAHELNIGTINGKTVEQIIDYLTEQFVENKIGNVGKYDGVITGEIALGNYVDMGGYTWRVCHVDNGAKEFYLILNNINTKDNTQFDNAAYAGSTVAGKCTSFMNTMSANVINLLKMKTVNGVTAKMFIPSYEQMNGGFDLFTDNVSRIVHDQTGATQPYWTSSLTGPNNIWYVNNDGSLINRGVLSNSLGFRPAVCLAL